MSINFDKVNVLITWGQMNSAVQVSFPSVQIFQHQAYKEGVCQTPAIWLLIDLDLHKNKILGLNEIKPMVMSDHQAS